MFSEDVVGLVEDSTQLWMIDAERRYTGRAFQTTGAIQRESSDERAEFWFVVQPCLRVEPNCQAHLDDCSIWLHAISCSISLILSLRRATVAVIIPKCTRVTADISIVRSIICPLCVHRSVSFIYGETVASMNERR